MNKSGKNAGFTIAEVSIATTIFSIILLVALAAFFAIGRLFYKSVSITQTQETTQQIIQDISGNIQSANSVTSGDDNGYKYYCVGNVRYTYNIDQQVNLDASASHAAPASGGTFGILRDTLKGTSSCAMPCNDQPGGGTCDAVKGAKFNNPVELLGQKMRIEKFDISSPPDAQDIYNVSMIVAYGDTDLLGFTVPGSTLEHYASVECKSGIGSQYCSVSPAETTIFRGIKF
jgi:prepilin-type N-terminal cleavage/methylation domain-containing protein